MSKVQLSAALVLVALLGAPVAAHAATPAGQTPTSALIFTEGGDDNGGDNQGDDEGDDDNGGGSFTTPTTKDKDDTFVVPPVVIHPGDKGGSHHFKPGVKPSTTPGSTPSATPGATPPVEGSDVSGRHPIRLDQVNPTAKTPTDVFVDTAMVGLGAVGLGALGLGTVIGVRAIRARRSGEKADYFYGE